MFRKVPFFFPAVSLNFFFLLWYGVGWGGLWDCFAVDKDLSF